MQSQQNTQHAQPDVPHPAERTLSLTLDASTEAVYDFVAQPKNLPHWAPNFFVSISWMDGIWMARTPSGPVRFRFIAPQEFGNLDHALIFSGGEEVVVPMRVQALGKGSEISITILRGATLSQAAFAEEISRVEHDLYTLKCIVECLSAMRSS